MRVALAIAVALHLAALAACYRCDGPGYPSCPDVQPDYPSSTRDASRD